MKLLQKIGSLGYVLIALLFFVCGFGLIVLGAIEIWSALAPSDEQSVQDRFRLIPLDPKNYFMHYVPIAWDWPTILALNAAAVVLIALVLWIPTIVVSRIQPIKALAFKK